MREFGTSNGVLPPGTLVTFWREVYSFYDGLNSYFFADPGDYFDGPPEGDERALRIYGFDCPHDEDPVVIRACLEALDPMAQPSRGRADIPWMQRWWGDKMAAAEADLARRRAPENG